MNCWRSIPGHLKSSNRPSVLTNIKMYVPKVRSETPVQCVEARFLGLSNGNGGRGYIERYER